jgi:hypothetical protein
MNDPNNTAPFAAGVAQADSQEGNAQELADTKAWMKRIEEAREFDEDVRRRYAVDRQFARGDRGKFAVGLPIAGTYVDILTAFLYAKNPDLDVQPADGTTPPPMSEIMKRARTEAQADPQTQPAMQAAAQGAQQQAVVGAITSAVSGAAGGAAPPPGGGDPSQPPAAPPDPQQAAQAGANAALEQITKQKADAIMAPYRQRAQEAKQFGQTAEMVVSFLWDTGRLKTAAEPQVRSAFTCGPGWIKATWQERMGRDPVMVKQLNDIQDNLNRLRAGQFELSDGYCADPDAKKAELEQLAAGISAKVEVVAARGMVFDFVAAEDIQLPIGVSIENYRESPWIAHRTFMSMSDAEAAFPELVGADDESNRLKKAKQYFRVKPRDTRNDDVGGISKATAADADSYKLGGTGQKGESSVCVWEVWNKQTNQILTFIDGLDGYAKAPYSLNFGTTRFYSFFMYAPTKCDGERHPQSMIQRTEALLEDMNRIYSNRAEFRRRTIPKTVFDATNLSDADANKIKDGGTQEMIPVKPTVPGANVAGLIAPVSYAAFNQALYDDGPTRAMLEMAWGIQEALSSSIQVAKTATEAEIQKNGTESRLSYMRDCLDEMMNDLAQYTAEVALQKLQQDDAVRIAGPFAFWPTTLKIEDLSALANVRIRAGSSGKPDTTAERESWAQTMPIVQAAVVQIGQLRGSSPDDIADCLEALVAETLRRSGDKIDPEQFMPRAPDSGASLPMSMPPLFSAPTVVPNGATLQ